MSQRSSQPDIGVHVVDAVVEDIRLGLEVKTASILSMICYYLFLISSGWCSDFINQINQPKFNQRRLSIAKYLGELYNYRMVESALIFKTLYLMITLGVTMEDKQQQQQPGAEAFDPIENMFRIRLVCALLDTCGQYFDRGSPKRKLDCFLLYFQRYYWYKRERSAALMESEKSHYPMEVEYLFTECGGTLRSEFKFAAGYQEACAAVAKMESDVRESLQKTMPGLMLSQNANTSVNNKNDQQQQQHTLGAIQEEESGGGDGGEEDDDEYGEEEEDAGDERRADDDEENENDEDDNNDEDEDGEDDNDDDEDEDDDDDEQNKHR